METLIDLATCTRSEFVAAYEILESSLNQAMDEIEALQGRLQEHEGIKPTQEEGEKEFQKFWAAYGRKGNVKTTRKRWFSLSKTKKGLAMDKVVAYIKSTPDKAFRKDGERWILNECWNDEIVNQSNGYGRPEVVRAIEMSKEQEEKKLAEAAKLRQANRGRNVKDILK